MTFNEPVWKRAVGEYIFDDRGKLYVDFTSGVMVTNLGHANPKIIEAIKKAIDTPLLFCYRYPFANKELLQKALLSFTDGIFSKVCFATTGAEAIENSMRICLRYSQTRDRFFFISFSDAFHGKTLGASLLSNINRYQSKLLLSCGSSLIKRFPYPTNQYEDELVMKKLTKLGKKCIALYIECIQGSTLRKASQFFLQALRKWTRDNNVVLVVDEIQTGFYRTGPKFSYEDAVISPDMICIGKGLTTSLPLSAIILSKKLENYINPELDSSTNSANPLSVAASLAAIEIYSSKSFLKRLQNSVKYYTQMMEHLRSKVTPNLEIIHPGGIFGGLKFNIKSTQKSIIDNFVYQCRQKGLFLPLPVGPESNIVKFTPPLTIKSEEFLFATNVMINVLQSLHCIQ